jgi:hypothetical protein
LHAEPRDAARLGELSADLGIESSVQRMRAAMAAAAGS